MDETWLTRIGSSAPDLRKSINHEKEDPITTISTAVKTILESVGEDPNREGLQNTPNRYAKALLFFTKGYQEDPREILNSAIFSEGHNDLVMVTDMELFSLCEHHLIPFTGRVRPPAPLYSYVSEPSHRYISATFPTTM
jgi:GTP cyclohydrolase I